MIGFFLPKATLNRLLLFVLVNDYNEFKNVAKYIKQTYLKLLQNKRRTSALFTRTLSTDKNALNYTEVYHKSTKYSCLATDPRINFVLPNPMTTSSRQTILTLVSNYMMASGFLWHSRPGYLIFC